MRRTSWVLRLLQIAASGVLFLPPMLSAQGAMANGQNYAGTISAAGEVDIYTFSATAGEYIAIMIGEVGGDLPFAPEIELFRPDSTSAGSTSGTMAAQIATFVPSTGTYSLHVRDVGLNDAGAYTLTLAKAPGAFTITAGDEGGAMTNGSNHTGTIHVGDLDMWSFEANAGDMIALGIGETGGDSAFVPRIRVRSPTGSDFGDTFGALAQQVEAAAPATGTYTVIINSHDVGFDASGSYTLTLATTPGPYTISAGDEGGPMTNGSNHTGFIHIGDLDVWTFTANPGDYIILSLGETGGDSEFVPRLRLRSPTGADLGDRTGVLAQQLDGAATSAGTYTVIVNSHDSGFDATGSYTLTLARTPGPFTISAGDEGGQIATGSNHTGSIHIGDLDMWSFIAHEGDPLTITVTDLNTPGTVFTPRLRLRSPTGGPAGDQAGATTASIITNAPATGRYTLVVSASTDVGFAGFGDYQLTLTGPTSNIIRNGDYSNAETFWQFFATPSLAYIVHEVTNGVLRYYRVPPPAGTSNQAVAYQETGVAMPAGAPMEAVFDLANTSTVRKRISILVLDSDFSDLSVCTFWLEPNAPMRTYRMRTHTTEAWTNTALYFYAASPGENGGRYEVDNVSLRYVETQAADRTDCVDPTVVAPPGGAPGPDLLVNGNFDTGTLAPWFTFGTITSNITNGIFQFIRPSGVPPSGVVAQPTGQTMTAGQILTATFMLGNTSSVRKRVTVILHDQDFTDLSACTFWLAPFQALSTYEYRTFATKDWANAMVSVYPATNGIEQWILLDDVTFQRTPGTSTVGTECIEPSGESVTPIETASPAVTGAPATLTGQPGRVAGPGGITGPNGARAGVSSAVDVIDLSDASVARLSFDSFLKGGGAGLEVSLDGRTWERLHAVPALASWTRIDVDLSSFAGQVIRVRFAAAADAVWRVGGVSLVIR